jgi:membrane protein DedA with SNARE-associated domain
MELAFVDQLTNEVSGNPVTYALIFAAAGGDVLFPIIPSETIVIAAAVLSAQGKLIVALVFLAAAVGAFIGDNTAYWLGRRIGEPAVNRLFRSKKARDRLQSAEEAVRERGGALIVTGRFIPGGRSASTVSAGTAGLAYRRRFIPADALAAVLWALYVGLLGYIGGTAFEGSVLVPLLIAGGAALLISLAVELIRRWRKRDG